MFFEKMTQMRQSQKPEFLNVYFTNALFDFDETKVKCCYCTVKYTIGLVW